VEAQLQLVFTSKEESRRKLALYIDLCGLGEHKVERGKQADANERDGPDANDGRHEKRHPGKGQRHGG
jgi:hypothetical protein